MSVARVYRVKHARQRYQQVSTGESIQVVVRGKTQNRRVRVADKTQPLPNYTCGKCRVEIKPGDPYIYWEPMFRSSYKVVRCTKSECRPRTSELESSKTASVYAAIESVEDQIEGIDDLDDMEGLKQEVLDALEEVRSEYEEASQGEYGQVWNTTAEELAEQMQSGIDELEGFEFTDTEVLACGEADEDDEDSEVHDDNVDDCPRCQEKKDEWLQERRDELMDALQSLPI